jgi:ACR3 family arsenite efflux pump ArsB
LLGRASQVVADWLDYSTAFNWLLNGELSGHASQILVSVIIWVAIPLVAGLVRTVRREIN